MTSFFNEQWLPVHVSVYDVSEQFSISNCDTLFTGATTLTHPIFALVEDVGLRGYRGHSSIQCSLLKSGIITKTVGI